MWLQNELLWYAERTRREATGGVGLSCAYLCRAAARNFTASQKDPRQYRTNLTSISHRGSPSVASPLRHHCYGLNPCYHGLIGCALLHIWLSITLMGCSNTLMGYPPPHPSTSSWLRCASDTWASPRVSTLRVAARQPPLWLRHAAAPRRCSVAASMGCATPSQLRAAHR